MYYVWWLLRTHYDIYMTFTFSIKTINLFSVFAISKGSYFYICSICRIIWFAIMCYTRNIRVPYVWSRRVSRRHHSSGLKWRNSDNASFENPYFNVFTLDRPTCIRNRLSAFQDAQGFSVPSGRCSSALMLRCTLASRGSRRSLHNSMRAAFVVVLMGSVHLIKLFRDFRRGTIPRCQLSGCFWSVVRRVRLATALLISGGAIPASTGRLLVVVGFRQPVVIRQVSFIVAFSFFARVERSHTGQAYSAGWVA